MRLQETNNCSARLAAHFHHNPAANQRRCVIQDRGSPGDSGAEMPFAIGDRVLVAGPPGELIGGVVGMATPDEVPVLEGAPPAEQVKEILREWQVDLLVLIAHKHDGRDVCFFALHHPGGWRDLQGQDIQITMVRGQA